MLYTCYCTWPYRSCDRGLNEYTNGLIIRKFFPKKTNFANISEKQIEHVQNLLNERPRKSQKDNIPDRIEVHPEQQELNLK